MKSLIIALSVLLIMICSLFYYQKTLHETSSELCAMVDDIRVDISREAGEKLHKLSDEWERSHNNFQFVLDHEYLSTISIFIEGMKQRLENEEMEEFKVELRMLYKMFEQIGHMEALTLNNIF